MTLVWFFVWFVWNLVGDNEPLVANPVNFWLGALIFAVALDLGGHHALARKAQGRVFQTDENKPAKPDGLSAGEWKKFTGRSVFEKLYFDWTVLDE